MVFFIRRGKPKSIDKFLATITGSANVRSWVQIKGVKYTQPATVDVYGGENISIACGWINSENDGIFLNGTRLDAPIVDDIQTYTYTVKGNVSIKMENKLATQKISINEEGA